MDGMIAGFERRRLPGEGVTIDTLVGGKGPPLLLLHGYPETRLVWKAVAPLLSDRFTLVIPDLRGYGRSDKPKGDPAHQTYSKRVMAADQLRVMQALGHSRFAVAGHDRGGRVAYRLALDHPEAVTRLALLDILPTGEMWAHANAQAAMRTWHWYFLAQPYPFPETMIGASAEFFLRTMLGGWSGKASHLDPEVMADYLACFSDPAAIHASCEDYRAGWLVDRAHDEADRGKHLIEAPLLVLWSKEGFAAGDPLAVWRNWARDVRGQAIECGHFIPEEAPEPTAEALSRFLLV